MTSDHSESRPLCSARCPPVARRFGVAGNMALPVWSPFSLNRLLPTALPPPGALALAARGHWRSQRSTLFLPMPVSAPARCVLGVREIGPLGSYFCPKANLARADLPPCLLGFQSFVKRSSIERLETLGLACRPPKRRNRYSAHLKILHTGCDERSSSERHLPISDIPRGPTAPDVSHPKRLLEKGGL